MHNKKTKKTTRAARSLLAAVLAVAFAGAATGFSVAPAAAQTVFPPVDVGGSLPARVYQDQLAHEPAGYVAGYAQGPSYGGAAGMTPMTGGR